MPPPAIKVIYNTTGDGCRRRRQHKCAVIFLVLAVSMAMQTDGKEGLCITARIVGFAKKSIFSNGKLE